MKKNQLIYIAKKNTFIVVIFIALISLSSCKTKIDFLTSAVVPAARGYVKWLGELGQRILQS